MKKIVVVLVCLVTMFCLTSCNTKESKQWEFEWEKEEKVSKTAYPEDKLKIQPGWVAEIEGNFCYVRGRVKNVSNVPILYYEIRVDYLNENNQVIDSDYTNDRLMLNPGDMREFEIMHRRNDEYKRCELTIANVR